MLRAVLDNLLDEERRQLNYAFENEMAQFVPLPQGKYIGVNAQHIKHLEPVETVGAWSYGNIKGAEDE